MGLYSSTFNRNGSCCFNVKRRFDLICDSPYVLMEGQLFFLCGWQSTEVFESDEVSVDAGLVFGGITILGFCFGPWFWLVSFLSGTGAPVAWAMASLIPSRTSCLNVFTWRAK